MFQFKEYMLDKMNIENLDLQNQKGNNKMFKKKLYKNYFNL